jgi:hypothetical protein
MTPIEMEGQRQAMERSRQRTPQNATTDAYATLEREAVAHAHSARAETRGIYRPDSLTRLTPERAVAQALEDDPSVYADYRERKQAGSILQTLAAAGIRLG